MMRLEDSMFGPPLPAPTMAPARSPRVGRRGAPPARLLRSFWGGGFESACHVNRSRQRLDMIAATQHDRFIELDYSMLKAFNIAVARDAVRWHLVDRGGGRYDFASLEPMADAAQRLGVQVIWNLCHYGWPEDVDMLAASFVDRFAAYARAVAKFFRERSDDVPFYTPVNEISFFAFAGGAEGFMHPFLTGQGGAVKRQLIRAAIAAMEAVWDVDPRARFVHCEPLIHVVEPLGAPEMGARATELREAQFEAWELMIGRLEPELGGRPKYLDICGCNFYASNQWDAWGGKLLWHVEPRDERWMPLHELLAEVHMRYGRPVIISETSHVGIGRGAWVVEVAQEVAEARRRGTPVEGIILYPIIDRHDWDCNDHWHNSGLWDLLPTADGTLRRVLCTSYADDLCRAQHELAGHLDR
jgi:hypothetical protein